MLVTLLRFDAVGHGRLIRNQQQRAGWDTVVETHRKQSGGFHIHSGSADFLQIILKLLIMFPYTAVGGVYRTCPIVTAVVADSGRDSLFQVKCRQGWHFRREIIVGGTLSPDGSDRQQELAHTNIRFQSTAFT